MYTYLFKIVHRRLAAQNILLNSQNEVKIYGFGPQSLEEEAEDAEKGEMVKSDDL
jgi:hypothetical protein